MQPPEDIAAEVGQTVRQLLWVSCRGHVGWEGLGGNPGLSVFSVVAAREPILPCVMCHQHSRPLQAASTAELFSTT